MSYQSSRVSILNIDNDEIAKSDIGCFKSPHNCHGCSNDFCTTNTEERSETISFDDDSIESNCFSKREILNKYRYGDSKKFGCCLGVS